MELSVRWGVSERKKKTCTRRRVMPDFVCVCSARLGKSLRKLVFNVDCHSQGRGAGGEPDVRQSISPDRAGSGGETSQPTAAPVGRKGRCLTSWLLLKEL